MSYDTRIIQNVGSDQIIYQASHGLRSVSNEIALLVSYSNYHILENNQHRPCNAIGLISS